MCWGWEVSRVSQAIAAAKPSTGKAGRAWYHRCDPEIVEFILEVVKRRDAREAPFADWTQSDLGKHIAEHFDGFRPPRGGVTYFLKQEHGRGWGR